MPSGADVVVLPGRAMARLVRAVAALAEAGLRRYAVVGGVAVTARLGEAHRATADVDAVVDETTPPEALRALLALPAAAPDPTGTDRVLVDGTRVEIIGVAPFAEDDLEGIPTKNALFLAAHAWALDTASPLTLVAEAAPSITATAPFATPAALVAMKLHAVQDRSAGSEPKRGADAWDLYRLLTDLDGDGAITAALAAAPPALRALVRDAAQRVLIEGARRASGWMKAGDDAMASVSAADLRFAARPLVDAL